MDLMFSLIKTEREKGRKTEKRQLLEVTDMLITWIMVIAT
jgi:hypothetical protein